MRLSPFQGLGCDRGIHRVQHLVHQAVLQRHAHSNYLFKKNLPHLQTFRCRLPVTFLLMFPLIVVYYQIPVLSAHFADCCPNVYLRPIMLLGLVSIY